MFQETPHGCLTKAIEIKELSTFLAYISIIYNHQEIELI